MPNSLLFLPTLLLLSSSPSDQHLGLGIPRYKGCPGNALCSEKAGLIRHQWKQLLIQNRNHPKRTARLEAFRRRQGIPLEVWTVKDKNLPGVHFDSPCGGQWMQSEVFAPDFTRLSKTVVRQGYLLRKKHIETWPLLRGDIPLYENKKRLYYNRHFEGEYYGISVGMKGDIRIEKKVTPLKPYHYPQKVACPSKLLNRFSKNAHSNRPDYHPRCLQIPDTSRSRLILLVGMSCP